MDQNGLWIVDLTTKVDRGDIDTLVPHETRSENEFPYPRMQSIGADDHSDGACLPPPIRWSRRSE